MSPIKYETSPHPKLILSSLSPSYRTRSAFPHLESLGNQIPQTCSKTAIHLTSYSDILNRALRALINTETKLNVYFIFELFPSLYQSEISRFFGSSHPSLLFSLRQPSINKHKHKHAYDSLLPHSSESTPSPGALTHTH